MVEVELRYDDPSHGIRQIDVVRLTKEKPEDIWKRFVVGKRQRPATARITYRGGRSPRPRHRDGPADGSNVNVPDPFPERLKVKIVFGPQLGDHRPGLRRPQLRRPGQRHPPGGVDRARQGHAVPGVRRRPGRPDARSGQLSGDAADEGHLRGRRPALSTAAERVIVQTIQPDGVSTIKVRGRRAVTGPGARRLLGPDQDQGRGAGE